MELTAQAFLIVCPLIFLAGLVDSIAGGGGLISIPAYLLAGLPPHFAVATNKLSSAFGTATSTIRYFKNGLVHVRLAIPSVLATIAGAYLGARLTLLLSEKNMNYILFAVLPITALIVLNKNLFADREKESAVTRKTYIIVTLSSFLIGGYDGFYGPGTGTFLVLAFTVLAKLNIRTANANSKVINLTSNLSSLVVFILDGKILFPLGLAAAACCIAGNYIGSGLVLSNGAKIVRPVILAVLGLLALKVFGIL